MSEVPENEKKESKEEACVVATSPPLSPLHPHQRRPLSSPPPLEVRHSMGHSPLPASPPTLPLHPLPSSTSSQPPSPSSISLPNPLASSALSPVSPSQLPPSKNTLFPLFPSPRPVSPSSSPSSLLLSQKPGEEADVVEGEVEVKVEEWRRRGPEEEEEVQVLQPLKYMSSNLWRKLGDLEGEEEEEKEGKEVLEERVERRRLEAALARVGRIYFIFISVFSFLFPFPSAGHRGAEEHKDRGDGGADRAEEQEGGGEGGAGPAEAPDPGGAGQVGPRILHTISQLRL